MEEHSCRQTLHRGSTCALLLLLSVYLPHPSTRVCAMAIERAVEIDEEVIQKALASQVVFEIFETDFSLLLF